MPRLFGKREKSGRTPDLRSQNKTSRLMLWLDDDLEPGLREWKEWRVEQVRTCSEAVKLVDGGTQFDGAVVDVIVPQQGWGTDVLEYPGIEFVRYFRKRQIGVPVVGFGILMDGRKRSDMIEAGASETFDKFTHGSEAVFDHLDSLAKSR